jgi:inhibitor of cysteine peptidase
MAAIYYQQDNEIVVQVGEAFVVELDGNPTTGYAWELAQDNERFRLVEKDYAQPGTGVGGSTRERFQIEALKPGSTTLSFEYKRPWETEVLDKKSFSLRVQPA